MNIKELNIRDPFILEDNGYIYLYMSDIENDKNCFVCYKGKTLDSLDTKHIIFMQHDGFWADKEYWAPEVHKYNNQYFLFASLKSQNHCRATQIFTCSKPDGVFVPLTNAPITPKDWECLDGTLYVENGTPYIIFSREWLQVENGEFWACELSSDLKNTIGEPFLLFKAHDAKWVAPIDGKNNYVTDGPFIVKNNGELLLFWSSFSKNGYAIGLSKSDNIRGKWIHQEKPIYDNNGGHPMIFNHNNERYIVFHAPNSPNGDERLQCEKLSLLI